MTIPGQDRVADGPVIEPTELSQEGRHQDHVEFPAISRSGRRPTAWQVDALAFYEFAVAAFFTALIFLFIVTLRGPLPSRDRRSDRSNPPLTSKVMEVALDRRARWCSGW